MKDALTPWLSLPLHLYSDMLALLAKQLRPRSLPACGLHAVRLVRNSIRAFSVPACLYRGLRRCLKPEMCTENRFTIRVYYTCLRFHLEASSAFDIVDKINLLPRLAQMRLRERGLFFKSSISVGTYFFTHSPPLKSCLHPGLLIVLARQGPVCHSDCAQVQSVENRQRGHLMGS